MRVPEGTLCLIPRGATMATSRPCGKPAGRLLMVGCRHEHISTKIVCDEHATFLLTGGGTTGKMRCQMCKTIDGHDCAVSAKEDTTA